MAGKHAEGSSKAMHKVGKKAVHKAKQVSYRRRRGRHKGKLEGMVNVKVKCLGDSRQAVQVCMGQGKGR